MDRKMRTIVFSDVDGTLLNSEHRITAFTKGAIDGLQRRGIPMRTLYIIHFCWCQTSY